jgi:hypothetical protein
VETLLTQWYLALDLARRDLFEAREHTSWWQTCVETREKEIEGNVSLTSIFFWLEQGPNFVPYFYRRLGGEGGRGGLNSLGFVEDLGC